MSDKEAIEELTEALRLTAEYAGQELLPAIPGWSWYDALVKYAPEKAVAFRETQITYFLDTTQLLTEEERKELKEILSHDRSALQASAEVQPGGPGRTGSVRLF